MTKLLDDALVARSIAEDEASDLRVKVRNLEAHVRNLESYLVEDVDLSVLLSATVRYSLPRKTYMSRHAWELVVKYQAHLRAEELWQIHREIKSEIGRLEELGTLHEIDHQAWNEGLKAIEAVLEGRRTI